MSERMTEENLLALEKMSREIGKPDDPLRHLLAVCCAEIRRSRESEEAKAQLLDTYRALLEAMTKERNALQQTQAGGHEWNRMLNERNALRSEYERLTRELMTLYPADTNGDTGVVEGIRVSMDDLRAQRDEARAEVREWETLASRQNVHKRIEAENAALRAQVERLEGAIFRVENDIGTVLCAMSPWQEQPDTLLRESRDRSRSARAALKDEGREPQSDTAPMKETP